MSRIRTDHKKTEKKGIGKTIKFTYFPSNTHSHTKRVVFYPLMTSFKQNKESFRRRKRAERETFEIKLNKLNKKCEGVLMKHQGRKFRFFFLRIEEEEDGEI